jgi:hypothetical protein
VKIFLYKHVNTHLLFLIGISFFGLFIILAIATNPPLVEKNYWFRKEVISSIFGLMCTFGILATLFPRRCSGLFQMEQKKDIDSKNSIYLKSVPLSCVGKFAVFGHHPNCQNFKTHVIKFYGRIFCAGCTGLFLGGFLSLIATFAYALNLLQVGKECILTVYLGVLGVGFGVLQPAFLDLKGYYRLISNSYFVLGAYLIFVGIDSIVQSITIDSFLILLIVFWIITRISISRWSHMKVCNSCDIAIIGLSSPETVDGSDNDQRSYNDQEQWPKYPPEV